MNSRKRPASGADAHIMPDRNDVAPTRVASARANAKELKSDSSLSATAHSNHLYQAQTFHNLPRIGNDRNVPVRAPRAASDQARQEELPRWKSDSPNQYQDYSGVKETQSLPSSRRGVRGPAASFLKRLHTLLRDAEEKEFSHIVSWASHGRAFRVHDSEAFVSFVMPQYFRQQKFTSFQRQLSIYGFERMTKRGPDQGSYWHALFLRGMPHLTEKMQRTTVKGKGVRTPYNPETEPDFYAMPAVGAASMPLARSTTNAATLPPSPLPEAKPSPVTAHEAAATRFEGDTSAYLTSTLLRGPLVAPMMPSTQRMPSNLSTNLGSFAVTSHVAAGETRASATLPSGFGRVVAALPPTPRMSLAPPPALPRAASGRLAQDRRPTYSEVDTMDLAFFLNDVELSTLREDAPPEGSRMSRPPR